MFPVGHHLNLDFLKFSVFFFFFFFFLHLDGNTSFFKYDYCYLRGFMCYIKRETRNCILKMLGKFSHGEQLQCSGPTEWSLMKSRFFFLLNWCDFLRKKKCNMFWLTGIFLHFWMVLKIFLNPRLSLIVPFNNDGDCKALREKCSGV